MSPTTNAPAIATGRMMRMRRLFSCDAAATEVVGLGKGWGDDQQSETSAAIAGSVGRRTCVAEGAFDPEDEDEDVEEAVSDAFMTMCPHFRYFHKSKRNRIYTPEP